MHPDHSVFINALTSMRRLRLTFYSKDDGSHLIRTCAPMDYGPSRRATDKSDRYHLWDFDSDTKRHVLSLLPQQVARIECLDDTFDPAGFVTWTPQWFFARDWGPYS